MNRHLRSRHRGIFVLLALTLPAGFVLALTGRRGPAVGAGMPAPALLSEATFDTTVTWAPIALRTGLARDADGLLTVRVHSWNEPAAPGLLLYWSADPPLDDELPSEARLLGPLGSSAGLPRDHSVATTTFGGWLLLYSLGHAEVVGSLELTAGEDL